MDPNIAGVELVALALGPLLEDVVLVGGCAAGLLISDPSRPAVRATIDVDLVTEVAPRASYYAFCERIKERGFRESSDSEVMCRWRLNELIVDIMPTEQGVLDFTNSWYVEAAKTANTHRLSSGAVLRVISAPLFVATKLEAFRARGGGDYLHHDLEDVINVIDGRPEIVEEVFDASDAVSNFVADELESLLLDPAFDERLLLLLGGAIERKPIVLERIRRMTGF